MSYNSNKLYQEITSAGVLINGCDSNGKVDYRPEATPAQIDLVERPVDGIKALHNPNILLPIDQTAHDDYQTLLNLVDVGLVQISADRDEIVADRALILTADLAVMKTLFDRDLQRQSRDLLRQDRIIRAIRRIVKEAKDTLAARVG